MVPPSINKFYIMDLTPESSLVRFAVENGHTVFMVSWKNPGHESAHLSWDDYIGDGVLRAIEVVKDIMSVPKINLLAFCVGGTMASTALAVLAARKDTSVQTLTLMTTLVDFSDTGVLDVFIDEAQVAMRETTIGEGGLLPGKELATTFSFLRPNDLVWNYVEKNYLKGETPPAFDILYWNADSTNLPGPFFSWYLRNTYLENNFVKPNRVTVCGEKIDLRKIDLPVYAFGAREDHIVPWQSAWASAKVMGPKARFVLGASGHIAGSINPASKNKRSYWTGTAIGAAADTWLEKAKEHPGSWWNDWVSWISGYKGKDIVPPKKLGKAKSYPKIEAAPGSYVKEKAEVLLQQK
jgi:polyhydroxyalkanoate synthase